MQARTTPTPTVDGPAVRHVAVPGRSPVARPHAIYTPILVWIVVLAVCLGMLYGRYNWDEAHIQFSRVGYFLSAFILVITLPTFFYTYRALAPRQKRPALVAVAILAVLCSLPYEWLGLRQLYYFADRPLWYCDRPNPLCPAPTLPKADIDWLPHPQLSLPDEFLFMGAFFVCGVAAFLWFIRRDEHNRFRPGLRIGSVFLLFFSTIVVETWLHLSLRSPFNYITYYVGTGDDRDRYAYWAYLFPERLGAVNGDYGTKHEVERLFSGFGGTSIVLRRPITEYFASQLSFFFNPAYVYIVINIGLWFVACVAMYKLTSTLFNSRVGLYAAALLATGTGFIFVAGQTLDEIPGYACYVLGPYLFEKLVVGDVRRRPGGFILFGFLLGLMTLVYDLFALLPLILIYAWIRRASVRGSLVSVALSVIVYVGFRNVAFNYLQIDPSENADFIWLGFHNITALIFDFHLETFYRLSIISIMYIFADIATLFFVWPAILAIFGAFCVRTERSALIIGVLALPGLVDVLFLTYGQTGLEGLPRLAYGIYPAVYILCALFLDSMSRALRGNVGYARAWTANAAVVAILASIFVLNNIDVFGYPQMYWHFYYSAGGSGSLP